MTDKAEDRHPRPKSAQMHWTIYNNKGIDPLHLGELADQIHAYICSSLPGQVINAIAFDGRDLTITLGEPS